MLVQINHVTMEAAFSMVLKCRKDGIFETKFMPPFFSPPHYNNCIILQCLDFSTVLFTMIVVFLVFYLYFALKQNIWTNQEV